MILTAQAFEHRLRLNGEPRGLRAAQLREARASLSRALSPIPAPRLAMRKEYFNTARCFIQMAPAVKTLWSECAPRAQ